MPRTAGAVHNRLAAPAGLHEAAAAWRRYEPAPGRDHLGFHRRTFADDFDGLTMRVRADGRHHHNATTRRLVNRTRFPALSRSATVALPRNRATYGQLLLGNNSAATILSRPRASHVVAPARDDGWLRHSLRDGKVGSATRARPHASQFLPQQQTSRRSFWQSQRSNSTAPHMRGANDASPLSAPTTARSMA